MVFATVDHAAAGGQYGKYVVGILSLALCMHSCWLGGHSSNVFVAAT